MKRELSILMPCYNGSCTRLVGSLQAQAAAVEGLAYEVLVADDASTDAALVADNRTIDELPHCHYIIRSENVGRARIRNFLARQARYGWLLFIDCDMTVCRDDFLVRYLSTEAPDVAYGGYEVGPGPAGNLRYKYEKEAEPRHTAAERQKRPYQDFHTANFLIRRDLMLAHPFDERFRHYGYEDVLLGKQLRKAGAKIAHIDNPVGFCKFEANADFVAKTEEGLRTLYEFRHELRGYNGLLTLADGIHLSIVRAAIRLWHRVAGPAERCQLTGNRPSLLLFRLYKTGYYFTLLHRNA